MKNIKGIMRNCKAIYNMIKFYDKKVIYYSCFKITAKLINVYLSLYLSTYIINRISSNQSMQITIYLVLTLVGSNFLLNSFIHTVDYKIQIINDKVANKLSEDIVYKSMSIDFEKIMNPNVKQEIQAAEDGLEMSGGLQSFLTQAQDILENFISFIASFVSFFLTLRYIKVPMMVLIVIIFFLGNVVINLLSNQWAIKKILNNKEQFFKENSKINRAYSYYRNISDDVNLGKDIRIYGFEKKIYGIVKDFFNQSYNLNLSLASECGKIEGINSSISTFSNGVLFCVGGILVVKKWFEVGDFLRFIKLSSLMSESLILIINSFGKFIISSKYICYCIDYIKKDSESDINDSSYEEPIEISFNNVSFKYPNSDSYVLKNINLKLTLDDQLALVGKNGSGKTTLILLLCGFYKPTSGQILINGESIYDNQQYLELFTAVFQDYVLFPFKIKENIAIGETYDEDKIIEILKSLDILGKVDKMPDKLDTYLYNELEKGYMISAGEAQMFAIARALYKGASFILLDEPTATLDPFHESEFYSKIYQLTKNKGYIFVTHRMSSCKFSKRILVLEDGRIVQEGSHDELVNEKSGLYSQLWEAQAQLYDNNR